MEKMEKMEKIYGRWEELAAGNFFLLLLLIRWQPKDACHIHISDSVDIST